MAKRNLSCDSRTSHPVYLGLGYVVGMRTAVREVLNKLDPADWSILPLSREPTPTGALAQAFRRAACTTQAGLALPAWTRVPGFPFLRANVARC